MSTMLSDLDLARRLEETESFASEVFALAFARRRPDVGVAVGPLAGGRAVFAGPGAPLTEAKAMGLHGPVTEDDLDRLEAFYFGGREPCRVFVCPMADPSLVEGLGRRGYGLSGFEGFLAMPLAPDGTEPLPPPRPDIVIRPADSDEADLYASVVAPNFAGPEGPTADLSDLIASMFGMGPSSAFLAYVDGQPAGGGAVLIHSGVACSPGLPRCPRIATGASTPPSTTRGWPWPAGPAATWPRRAPTPAAPPSATPSAADSASPIPAPSSSATRPERAHEEPSREAL
jgi:hypothetical protein